MQGARRVVVTGGGGRIAQVLSPMLAENGFSVRALTHRELDITDSVAVDAAIDAIRPECVINLAALTDVDACELRPVAAYAVNVAGVEHLAAACTRNGARLVQLSSDYVFDGTKRSPYDEADVAVPLSVYGRTKLAGEFAAGPSATVVRTAWVCNEFGPNLVHSVLAQAAKPAQPLRFIDDQLGSPTSAVDLAATLVLLVDHPQPGVVHVTNKGHATWFDLARYVLEVAGYDAERAVPIATGELAPPPIATRPAYSVLGHAGLTSRGLPPLAHWNDSFEPLVHRVVAAALV